MLRPYILCRHTAYVGTHRRPQCAPACSPSSLPSAPRVLEAIRPSPPPTATRSPSASGIRSSRSRGSPGRAGRSEEHTSELQSHHDLVCRLLLEKKKNYV